MLYGYIVKKKIRETFEHVNHHRWEEAVADVAPNIHHRVSGNHALAGERHDKQSLLQWFKRLGLVQPKLHIDVDNIWVNGWPGNTTVFVRWVGTSKLLNGDNYVNRGLHVLNLRWGKVFALEEYQDSQAAANALLVQSKAGLNEAASEQILS